VHCGNGFDARFEPFQSTRLSPVQCCFLSLGADMQRREFISLLGGAAAAWPLAVRAQRMTMPVIGFLQSGSPTATAHTRAAFHSGLREAGYVEGENVGIVYRYADGQYDRLPALTADLISNHVAAIFAGGPPAAQAAKAVTTTIPIVFTSTDPVKSGLVASLNRPGGNLTGVAFFVLSLGAKQFGLLRELVPNAITIGMLVNPKLPDVSTTVADGQAAARAQGLEVLILHASSDDELLAAFADMRKRQIDALVVVSDIFFDSRRDQLATLAARHTIPAIYPWRDYVMVGGLMSYGTSVTDGYRQAGNYIARILKGAQPSDLPVVQPTKFELVINLKAAKELGLTVPLTLQVAADEVIE
jgi:putative ABC transport system substrate-binding protein